MMQIRIIANTNSAASIAFLYSYDQIAQIRINEDKAISKYVSMKNLRQRFQQTIVFLNCFRRSCILPHQLKIKSDNLSTIGNSTIPIMARNIIFRFCIGSVELYSNYLKLSCISYLSGDGSTSSLIHNMMSSTGIKSKVAILTIITKKYWQFPGINKLIMGM